MPERVIHEVRVVETDDGFRVEVKGDKERIREMGFGPGMMGFGGRMHRRRHHRRGRGPRGRYGRHFGWWWGPWWDAEDEEDAGPEGEPRGEPPAQE